MECLWYGAGLEQHSWYTPQLSVCFWLGVLFKTKVLEAQNDLPDFAFVTYFYQMLKSPVKLYFISTFCVTLMVISFQFLSGKLQISGETGELNLE